MRSCYVLDTDSKNYEDYQRTSHPEIKIKCLNVTTANVNHSSCPDPEQVLHPASPSDPHEILSHCIYYD